MKTQRKDENFPVVGIGASAGGLEAFIQFLKELPSDTGFAYVFIQHLDPHHKSVLTDLLARETSLPVVEAVENMKVEANHVYVIPPNANLAILHGTLYLMPREEERGAHLSIDYFLNSLAKDKGSSAIGVILSGTASDGVFGLKAIKAEGGITFAQDETSAKYTGMPHSAIAAGCVDFVMPPEAIAREIGRISKHPYFVQAKAISPEMLPEAADDLGKLFILLRKHSGVDFSYYKQATISRRIKRRMLLLHKDDVRDYVKHLQEYPIEVDALYHDLLINVTTFFRDPESFTALKEQAFPEIMKARPPDAPVRIWVPGCSTGEEVYSIAISFLEFLGDRAGTVPLQFFATDIDEPAIEKARSGFYGLNISEEVSQERLSKFFVKSQSGYQINKSIRDLCVFAKQNVFKDPPFSKLDLVSCRNVLIYFGQMLQKKVFSLFHYALKPSGFLFLGSAETVGEFSDLFRIVDQKAKLYAKKSIATPVHFDFHNPVAPALPSLEQGGSPAQSISPLEIQKEVDRLLLDRFAPPGVVIDEHMDILLFRGKTGPYIEPSPGEASLNLLRMAKTSLQMPLRAVVTEAIRKGVAVRKEIPGTEPQPNVAIEILPLKGNCNLVLFEPIVEAAEPKKRRRTTEKARTLEQELAATREYLQSVIEQQETTNEELRSANEEIQSSNEELQSINEELETAKEELQSVNEELATVNDELESKNYELTKTNSDLINLVDSVNVPLVIVGPDLKIRRISPMKGPMNLVLEDIGRSILDVGYMTPPPGMEQILLDTMKSVIYKELEVQDKEGHWYSMRVRPYLTLENRIDGAVIAFVDIDEIKKGRELAKEAREYTAAVMDALKYPALILDKDLRVVSANQPYLQTFQVSQAETVDNLLYRLGNGQWAIPELRSLLGIVFEKQESLDDYSVEHEFERIGMKKVSICGRRISREKPLLLMQIEVKDQAIN